MSSGVFGTSNTGAKMGPGPLHSHVCPSVRAPQQVEHLDEVRRPRMAVWTGVARDTRPIPAVERPRDSITPLVKCECLGKRSMARLWATSVGAHRSAGLAAGIRQEFFHAGVPR